MVHRVASDPKREGYGNRTFLSGLSSDHALQVTRKEKGMATLFMLFNSLSVFVASDPKREGYGNSFNGITSPQMSHVVASDPKREGYGNYTQW